jgi:hypothetical protein
VGMWVRSCNVPGEGGGCVILGVEYVCDVGEDFINVYY